MASVHKPANRDCYYVKLFHPVTGEQLKRSTGTGDIRAAKRWAKRFEEELLHPPSVLAMVSPPSAPGDAPPAGPTVAELMKRWLDDRGRRGLKSLRNDRSRAQNHILPALGSRVASEIRPREVRAFVADLRARGLAPRTIRNVWTILRRFFADLEANEDIPSTPCKLLRGDLPTIEDKNPEWRVGARLTRAEAELILGSQLIPPDRRVMNTLLLCAGLRQGEVAALRWRHVDTTREPLGALIIANTGTSSGTKTGVTREIPIHPLLAQVLADWRERGWVAMNKRAAKPDDLVVPSREAPEQVRRPQPMWERWKDDLKKLGLHHRDMHATRRTFMDFGLEAGVAEEVLLHLTHTPRKTMINAYGRRPWKQLCDAVLAIEITPRDAAGEGGEMRGFEGPRGPRNGPQVVPGLVPNNPISPASAAI